MVVVVGGTSPDGSGVDSEDPELSVFPNPHREWRQSVSKSTQGIETKMATLGGCCMGQSVGEHLLQQALVVELVRGWQTAAAEREDAPPLAVIPWRDRERCD